MISTKSALKGSIRNGHYSRNQFDRCPQRLLGMENSVSLREAVSRESASGVKATSSAIAVVPSVATQIAASASSQN